MKKRVSLVLIEQLIMILVFALSAAVCLGIFTEAYRVHRHAEDVDAAVMLAQNAAEILKSVNGDFASAAQTLGGQCSNGVITMSCSSPVNAASQDSYLLHIQKKDAVIPLLGQAEIQVMHPRSLDTVLYALTVAWQEAAP